jgi:hypothetical protein
MSTLCPFQASVAEFLLCEGGESAIATRSTPSCLILAMIGEDCAAADVANAKLRKTAATSLSIVPWRVFSS